MGSQFNPDWHMQSHVWHLAGPGTIQLGKQSPRSIDLRGMKHPGLVLSAEDEHRTVG